MEVGMNNLPHVNALKAQASRLREFLSRAGVELKHTHALEAVARMHNAKDWHSLAHAAEQSGEASLASAAHIVVSHYYGHADVVQCGTRQLAIHAFLQRARLLADLMTEEDAKEIRVYGQDQDDGLPVLRLVVKGDTQLTMQPAMVASFERVVGRTLRAEEPVDLLGLEDIESYYSIGRAIEAALGARENLEARYEQAAYSWPARSLVTDYEAVGKQLAEESSEGALTAGIRGTPEQLLAAIDTVHVGLSTMATVRG